MTKRTAKRRPNALTDDNSPIIIGDSGTSTPLKGSNLKGSKFTLPASYLCIRHATFHVRHDLSVTNQSLKVLTVGATGHTAAIAAPWTLTLNKGSVILFSVDNITVNIITDSNDYDLIVRKAPATDLIIPGADLSHAVLVSGNSTTDLATTFPGATLEIDFG